VSMNNFNYQNYWIYSAGKEIDCFECNSWDDPRCHDPFNFTAFVNDMPKIVACEGCCVKLVRDRGKAYESVQRTCTDSIDINLFMVDHVCMTEGGRDGHMCFCEENKCNGTGKLDLTSVLFILIFIKKMLVCCLE